MTAAMILYFYFSDSELLNFKPRSSLLFFKNLYLSSISSFANFNTKFKTSTFHCSHSELMSFYFGFDSKILSKKTDSITLFPDCVTVILYFSSLLIKQSLDSS